MSGPTDFDAIAASLRRQLSPPDLDDVVATVIAAATEAERVAVTSAGVDRVDRVASVEVPAANDGRGRRWAGLAVAFAAAAALVLVLGPWRGGIDPGVTTSPPSGPTTVARAPTAEQIAGRQLVEFLRAGAALPGDPGSCSVVQTPPTCNGAGDGLRLRSTPDVQLMGECGGATGVDCAGHDLPAQRAMLVRLMPSGASAIVCIEPPWADPRPQLPEDSEYKIFRRVMNGYVLYEVTPLDEPHAVDHLAP